MAARIRFHLDEHIPNAVAHALRRYGIDVTTPADVGLRQAADLAHLAYAAREGRVFVTQDADFLRHHHAGVQHAGIAYCVASRYNIGAIVESLSLLYEVLTPLEMQNWVEFL